MSEFTKKEWEILHEGKPSAALWWDSIFALFEFREKKKKHRRIWLKKASYN